MLETNEMNKTTGVGEEHSQNETTPKDPQGLCN